MPSASFFPRDDIRFRTHLSMFFFEFINVAFCLTEPEGRCPTRGLEKYDTRVFFPNSLSLISRFRHQIWEITYALDMYTRATRSCSFSAGFPWAGHRSSNPLSPVLLRPEPCSEPGGGPISLR